MQEFIDAIDGLPAIVKYLLCIPVVSVVWMIYRICRSVAHNNTLGLVLGIVLLIVGIPFMWLVDLICLLLIGRVLWID